jgi:hypothetical protein
LLIISTTGSGSLPSRTGTTTLADPTSGSINQPSDPTTEGSSSNLGIGDIIGIVAGVVGAVAGVVAAYFGYKQLRKRGDNKGADATEMNNGHFVEAQYKTRY